MWHFTGYNYSFFILMTCFLLLIFYFPLGLHFIPVCSLSFTLTDTILTPSYRVHCVVQFKKFFPLVKTTAIATPNKIFTVMKALKAPNWVRKYLKLFALGNYLLWSYQLTVYMYVLAGESESAQIHLPKTLPSTRINFCTLIQIKRIIPTYCNIKPRHRRGNKWLTEWLNYLPRTRHIFEDIVLLDTWS